MRERENNFRVLFFEIQCATLRLLMTRMMQPPLSVSQARTLGLSRNNHDPSADSVPYFQQLIRPLLSPL